ncbi:glycoside hydrolase family 75 protein [Streptomyces sp. NPDC090306]|uniref:glycoside hydrolase family 75 protein n=1 Tax=Streptomyces sp. NPDC090306 TaxID=3365961 RepID=UPI00380A7475
MRARSLVPAALCAALLAPVVCLPSDAGPPAVTALPGPADAASRAPVPGPPAPPRSGPVPARTPRAPATRPRRTARSGARRGAVGAAELLAGVRDCVPVSRGRFRTDAGERATVPVCGARGAVYWTADLDVDCDGRPGRRCNEHSDPAYTSGTAYPQSDGRDLDAEHLPYVVVPGPGERWDHRDNGVRGGSVAALVHRDRVRYAVVGDTGPEDLIGEASYAAARSLGIRADPRGGGADAGVTYIVFENSRVPRIEDRAAAEAEGERLARRFVSGARTAAPDADAPAEPVRPGGGGPATSP